MEVASSLVSLGIDFVPVPGLASAFEILVFIWKIVQKASNNKRALRNLAVSSADILAAVNQLLARKGMNEHVRDLLCKLEKVLSDIRRFAEEHVTTNIFKNFIRSNDTEGKIESFQNRLQNLSMAFNIAAYATIESQLDKIIEVQHATSQISQILPTMPHSSSAHASESTYRVSKETEESSSVIGYEPVRVGTSSSESCRIEIRNGAPLLISRYLDDMGLSDWGLRVTGSKFVKKIGGFDIIWPQNAQTWTWTVACRTVSVSLHNPARSTWKDIMDIVFPSTTSAAAWFSWIQGYASVDPASLAQSDLSSCKVTVRKKYDCWMRRTSTHIERRRPTNPRWTVTLSGHSRSCKSHPTHFNYVATGSLPFATVYRSGDTIVHERSVRADNEEPSTARRFCFNTEAEARDWYAIWKDCALLQHGDGDPVQVGLTFRYPCNIDFLNNEPVLVSTVWPDLLSLNDWGLRASKSTITRAGTGFKVATVTTSWSWMHTGNQVVIYTTISSQPDWIDILEIAFSTAASALWFAYLLKYSTKSLPLPSPPSPEAVMVTITRVCWMQKTQKAIETRTAMLDTWRPIFGDYKSMETSQSHLALVDTSPLPHLRIVLNGHTLALERRATADASEVPISRDYQFGSKADARAWYEVWKVYLRQRIPLTHQDGGKRGQG